MPRTADRTRVDTPRAAATARNATSVADVRRNLLRLELAASTILVGLSTAAPAGAQDPPEPGPEIGVFDSTPLGGSQSDGGGFGAVFVIFVLVAIGFAIFKFVTVRDMGIRRGLSERDATAAALFSDDEVTSTMILRPEASSPRPRPLSTPAPAPSIEERLATVESLRDKGVISDAEAESRRAEILDEI